MTALVDGMVGSTVLAPLTAAYVVVRMLSYACAIENDSQQVLMLMLWLDLVI
jgi:hypothetical protein